jgi:hypothetical protein
VSRSKVRVKAKGQGHGHIKSSWQVKVTGQGHRSRSKVKVAHRRHLGPQSLYPTNAFNLRDLVIQGWVKIVVVCCIKNLTKQDCKYIQTDLNESRITTFQALSLILRVSFTNAKLFRLWHFGLWHGVVCWVFASFTRKVEAVFPSEICRPLWHTSLSPTLL